MGFVWKLHRGITLVAFVAVVAGLIVFANPVKQGILDGMLLCFQVLIPALFPFFCLCHWIKSSHLVVTLSGWCKPFFRAVMGKTYPCGVALLLCLLGGYPMGVTLLNSMVNHNQIPKEVAQKLSLWIFCPSPAFVIIGVGQGMLYSVKIGLVLWLACALATLMVGRVLSWFIPGCRPIIYTSQPMSMMEAVYAGCRTLVGLCGIVVLLSGLTKVLQAVLPVQVAHWLTALGEVTTGCVVMIENGGSLPVIGFLLSFGGVCTHLQCKMILGTNMPGYWLYCAIRLIQAGLCYGILMGFCYWFPSAVSTLSTGTVTAGSTAILPGVALLLTCIVFLCSLQQRKEELV